MKSSLIDEITTLLGKVPIVKNLARRKFIYQFVLGLIKSRNRSADAVQFCEVAHHLNDNAKLSSNEIRIQPGRRSGLLSGSDFRLFIGGYFIN